MSLLVDDSAAEWVFSTPNSTNLTMHEAGWHQLANDPSADTNGYFNSTALWTRTPGATASLIFQGTDIYLYSAKSPQGGHMNITCDWNSTAISLNQTELQPGEMVWHASGLDSSVQHAVRVQMMGEGWINIDKVGIDPGPPSAIPPVIPSPIPPAFSGVRVSVSPEKNSAPSVTTVTSTSVMTMTMTMTMTASVAPSTTSSSEVSLSKGALAGVIIGPISAILILGMCIFMCCGRRQRRSGVDKQSGINHSGLRDLSLLSWVRRRSNSGSHTSEPSFMQIEDREKAEEDFDDESKMKGQNDPSGTLPSIRRLSTLSLGQSAIFSTPTPPRSILAQFSQPPLHRSTSPPRAHYRDRSLAMSLSINTDLGSVREDVYVGTVRSSRAGSSTRGKTVRSVRRQHRTSDGFSTSDITEEWQEVNFEKDGGTDVRGADDALFYTEHFSSKSDHAPTDGKSIVQEDEYVDEPDDMMPDTPLLMNSPAIASSNASLAHHDSEHSHTSRSSKVSKILHSLHSRSSKRSSLRRSVGRLSRRSSVSRTPDARTPVSKYSSGSNPSDSPHSERRGGRLSTLSGLSIPFLTADPSGTPQIVPPVPRVPEDLPPSSPSRPPSAWTASVPPPSRRVCSYLRAHKPAGPRERSSSNASIISKTSSDGSSHSRTSSLNERGGMLSIVEEASRSGSVRTSIDRDRDDETSRLLYN